MQKITPFLWFNDQAEEAVKFYTSIFKNSKIRKIARYGGEGADIAGRPKGSVMTVAFQLGGQAAQFALAQARPSAPCPTGTSFSTLQVVRSMTATWPAASQET